MNSKKILIISDSVIDRANIKDILSNNTRQNLENEYIVYEASNGTDALDFLLTSNNITDIIILDIAMPTMNGRQFLKILLNNPELKAIPIIAICPRDDVGSEAYALENGAVEVIHKPFVKEIFAGRVNNIFIHGNPHLEKLENKLLNETMQTQDQLQGIMDNMDGGVAMVEITSQTENNIIYLNNGFYDLFNYSKEEFETKKLNFINVNNIGKADELIQKISRSLITKEKFSIETKAYQKNKTEIYLQIHGSVLSNQKSDFPVVLLIIYDISDLKKYEFELVQTNKKLKYRANYDVLTNIYNRGAFLDEVEVLLDKNPNIEYVMLLFNIEKFKAINEILGVKTGDEILKRFALYLREELKDNAVYGRIEADHFAVCLEYRALDEDKLTNQLDHAFDEMHLNHRILVYAGAYIIKDRRLQASQLLDRASIALRGNKHNYLHRLNYYDDLAHSSLLEEQEVVAEMQDALLKHEFEVHLQAIYSIDKRCITKAEALVRWRHPEKGLLYPSKFIPIFEKNGFIIELDYFVWEEVCKYIRSRMDRGLAPINISVNISRINIYRNDLAEKIYNLTKKYDIPQEMLELEITESAYSSNPELLKKAISSLKEKGFTVLMDDFGSAYSSLNSLKDLNFDILKIDMKFIEDFDTSRKSSSILSSIIGMTKALDMKVVAEGVETIEQFNYLSRQKCDLIQGYLISKPVTMAEFESKPLSFSDKAKEAKDKKYDFLYDNNILNKNDVDSIFGAFAIIEAEADDLTIINYNKAFLDILGYKDDEIAKKYNNFKALVLAEDYKRFSDDLSYAITSKNLLHSTVRMFGKDGSIKNIDVHIHFIGKNDSKKLICLNLVPISLGVGNENLDFIRHKSMLEVIPSMVAFASVPKNVSGPKDLNVMYINDRSRKFNGYTFEEYMEYSGNDFLVLVHPDDKENVGNALQDFFKKQVPTRVYFRIAEKDSSNYKWLALYLSSATTTNDTIYFSFAIVDVFNLQDIITLNNQGEKYTIKEYLKRLYDDYPNMLVQLAFVDGKYKVVFANEKFLRFLKLDSIEDLINRFDETAFPFILPEQKLKLSQTLSRILESGEPYNFSRTFILDNKQYLINISAHRIVNIDGQYILHLLMSDVTTESSQKAEEELSKFVSIFGSVYDSIYECDVENDTYKILKSPLFNEGIKGSDVKKLISRVLNEYIYEEDLLKAKQFASVLFENNPTFEKENAKLRLYHNDKVTYGLFNITRISRTIFMFGFNILNEERLAIETYQELEKDLRESKKNEELYRSAIENMGVCLIRFNVKQNYMSPGLEKYNLFKCRDYEAFKNADNIVQFSDRDIFKNFIAKLEAEGKAEEELRLRTIDDNYFYNVIALNKVSELDGTVNYYGYVKDIHKVKIFNEIGNAKEKLAGEKNKVLASLVNSLPVGLGVYEIENNKVYPVYLTNFLLDILELPYSSIDRSIKEHIPVDEITDAKYLELLEYAKGNKSYIYKRYIEMNNGNIKWISVALALRMEEDRLRAYTSVLDVTETVSLDSALHSSNNYLRELITSSNSIYYEYEIVKDKLEYFTLIGNKFESNEIKGYFKYFNASSNIQEEYKERIIDALDNIKNKKVASESVECIAKFFGDYQWYKIEMNAILDERSQVVKVAGQIINIDKEIIRRKEYVRLIERDQLSGLINRITAQKYIVAALKEENKKFAFMMIDIDSFKGLNDNYGHPFGDEVIKKISQVLKELFEKDLSIASRFGGDEFVTFMQYEKKEDLIKVLDELYARVSVISKECLPLGKITLSVGIALSPSDAHDFDNLFLKADEALYKAKTNGKNRYCWYDESI